MSDNLVAKRGDTFERTLLFTDGNNVPINITGYVVRFTLKEKIDDADTAAKIQKNISVHSNPTAGETILLLSKTDTDLAGKYLYDIEVEDTDHKIYTVLEGVMEFIKDVTRRSAV